MNIVIKTVVASSLLVLSTSALAAKPTSIIFDANGTTADGTPYSSYLVKCSNGRKMPLTAWDNRKKWCVGDATSQECEKKQIKAAKKACKAS
jgi:hypothetical protein